MAFLGELWLAILVSGILVFLASSILHMVLPLHRNDYAKMPNEDQVLEAMRENGVSPGQYMFPCAGSVKNLSDPAVIAKFEKGPVGHMVVLRNGMPSMGKSLLQWFLYCILVSVFAAYATRIVLQPGADYLTVFRVTGTIAVAAYALGAIPDSIWKGVSWTTTAKFILDGVIYGVVTAGAFGWLWPEA